MAESELYVSGIGISKNVSSIDVCIDELVFPKE